MNTNSLVEPITKPIELQSQPPFLLYRNQRSAISGFWFYCKEDCVRIYALLEKLIKKAGVGGKADPAVLHQHQQQHQPPQGQRVIHINGNVNPAEKKQSDIDIFSMLSKAQAEFSGSGSGIEQQLSDMKIGQPAHPPQNQQATPVVNPHQPLMKQISMTMPDITSPNVVSFFAAAQQPNGVIPIIAENQHHGPPMITKPFMNVQSGPGMVPHHPIVQPPVQTLDEIEKQHRVQSISPKVDSKLLNNLLNTSLQQQQQIIHPQPIQSSSPQPMKLLQQQPGPSPSSQPQPKLLAPTMFQASSLEDKLGVVQLQPPQQQTPRSEPLTHNQLIQAINYLLENDPEFIRKIHEAYIKSFNKMVSL